MAENPNTTQVIVDARLAAVLSLPTRTTEATLAMGIAKVGGVGPPESPDAIEYLVRLALRLEQVLDSPPAPLVDVASQIPNAVLEEPFSDVDERRILEQLRPSDIDTPWHQIAWHLVAKLARELENRGHL